MDNCPYDIIAIVGPTASGKTLLAANLASRVNGEIISADSRQVYRGMNLGTGKDYEDYVVNGKTIPYHLVDLVDAGYHYNVYEYQSDFLKVFVAGQRARFGLYFVEDAGLLEVFRGTGFCHSPRTQPSGGS